MRIAFIIAFGLVARLVVALTSKGYYHPDEFESYLERAYYWAFPTHQHLLDIAASDAYRSRLIQGWHYLLIKATDVLVGFSPDRAYTAMRVIMALLSLVLIGSGVRMARRLMPERWVVIVALVLSFWYYMPFFASRLLSENYSALMIMPALALLAAQQNVRRAATFGALVAIATQFRLQSAFLMIGAVAVWLLSRRPALAVAAAAGFFGPFALFGLSEALYREGPFASLRWYIHANITQGQIGLYASPWYQYLLSWNVQFTEWLFPFVLVLFAIAARRHVLLGATLVVFVAVHSVFPHKEIRFLYPILPAVIVMAIAGAYELHQRWAPFPGRQRALMITLAAAILGAEFVHIRRTEWAGGATNDGFRMLALAGTLSECSQVSILGAGLQLGYFTLNRDIPMTRADRLVGPLPPPVPGTCLLFTRQLEKDVRRWLALTLTNTTPVTAGRYMVLERM